MSKHDSNIRRFNDLKSRRVNWEEHWDNIAEFVYPQRQAFVQDPIEGQRFLENVYDSTAIVANERLASALNGMLTNPASKWFNLKIANKQIDEQDEVRLWLQDAEEKMFNAMNSPRANFVNAMNEVYMEYGAFGTSVLFVGLNRDFSGLLFQARPLAEMILGENSENKIDSFFRKFKFTLMQIEDQWPGKMSSGLKKKLQKTPDEKIDILHIVQPRKNANSKTINKFSLPFESFYIEFNGGHELEESGFEELPYMAPRFNKTSREIYGRGPGTTALPEIKMLNEVKKTDIKSRQLSIMPPMMVESDNVLSPVRLTPAGLTAIESNSRGVIPLNIGGDISVSNDMVTDSRNVISLIFFSDQIALIQRANMTATEVLQRTEDKLRLLGPVLGRAQTELLGPMIDRVFGLMLRGGSFLPLPEPLSAGARVEVEYSSPIARAQKQLEAQGILRTMDIMELFVNTNPEMLDNVDVDKAFRSVSNLFGVPADFLRREQTVKEMRENRQKAQQQQQEMSQNREIAETNKIHAASLGVNEKN